MGQDRNLPSALIADLQSHGFVNAGQLALSSQEGNELARLTIDVYEGLTPDHPHYLSSKDAGDGVRGLPQHHSRISELLNQGVSNADVKAILSAVLGSSYKIWQIDFRRSRPGDNGLYLHQDAWG